MPSPRGLVVWKGLNAWSVPARRCRGPLSLTSTTARAPSRHVRSRMRLAGLGRLGGIGQQGIEHLRQQHRIGSHAAERPLHVDREALALGAEVGRDATALPR